MMLHIVPPETTKKSGTFNCVMKVIAINNSRHGTDSVVPANVSVKT
jgi:hypothetical protein